MARNCAKCQQRHPSRPTTLGCHAFQTLVGIIQCLSSTTQSLEALVGNVCGIAWPMEALVGTGIQRVGSTQPLVWCVGQALVGNECFHTPSQTVVGTGVQQFKLQRRIRRRTALVDEFPRACCQGTTEWWSPASMVARGHAAWLPTLERERLEDCGVWKHCRTKRNSGRFQSMDERRRRRMGGKFSLLGQFLEVLDAIGPHCQEQC